MQVRTLRRAGLAFGAAAWVAAAALALPACSPAAEGPPPPEAQAPESAPQGIAALPPPAALPAAPASEPLVQTADAPAPPRPPLPKAPPRTTEKAAPAQPAAAAGLDVEFIVKFKPTHPMGRALALAKEGKAEDAAAAARRTLRQYRHLAGLCFVRFTLGGSEVVLAPCPGAPPPRNPELAAKNWLRYLKDIGGVAYVDRNVEAAPTVDVSPP